MSVDAANQTDADELDLKKLVLSIWGSRYMIAMCSAVGLGLAGAYIASTPPTFQADALLQLEKSSGGLAMPSGLADFMQEDSRAATEIEIIGSRLIIAQVVADHNLDWEISPVLVPLVGTALARFDLPFPEFGFMQSYGRYGDAISVDLLEVPPDWVEQVILITSDGNGAFSATLPDETTVSGKVGAVVQGPQKGFALKLGQLTAPAGRQFSIEHLSERKAIDAVREGLSITERGRQSAILELRVKDTNKAKAIVILNAIAEGYVRQNIDRSSAVAESSLEFINQQLPEAQTNLEAAEKALNDYRQKQQSVDLTFETENVLSQVTRIEGELRVSQSKEDEIKQRYKTSHPIYQQLLAQRQRLNDDLAKLRGEVEALPETQKEVLNLSRDLELAQQIYTELLTRSQEVRVMKASTVGNVRIIDRAEASVEAVAPKIAVVLTLGLLIGAMIGVMVALLRGWLRKSVQGAETLEAMGLSVFATINLAGPGTASGRKSGGILAVTDPTDLAVEGLRSLRTSLQFGMLDATSRSLAITSTAPGAGKSFSSVNLAAVTAQTGQTVCLIDADMRRGQLRKFFDVAKNGIGLSEYLAGEKTLEEVLRPTKIPGLSFIATGRYPPNPSELLMRKRMSDLIAELNTRFDMTVLDCPPVLAVTDPVIIGGKAGGVLAVVRFDETPIAEVQAMVKALDSSGVKLIGTILNGYDPRKAKAAGTAGYNYRYEYKSRTD